ncbi:MAG: tRNA (N(6)-L-threonylcarbamoyladenosine(37)-C(2))-methylthiotransferase MtaB [Candidatus Omnitrophica bacterium]|nr:tRNA (N(6)-L-threonylcarbamoyladenosine(37)-C(2))-methylthiotransferase MtaB [Candidatus Omnitrophota bacterium]
MRTCAFITFGCKVNQYDTQAIREGCERLGLRTVPDRDAAEVYVINTCSVTEDADRETWRTVRRIRRRQPDAQIILTGCLVSRKLHGLDGADLIVPTRQKHLIAGLILDPLARDAFQPCFDGGYSPLSISTFTGHTRAFLKIQDGCNYQCSFCKIPQVRGRSVSRPLPEILDEANRLLMSGHREIVLTGVSLGNYGVERPGGPDLADVVESLLELKRLTRLRLSSIEPSDLSDRLLELIAGSPILCRHLHLPLQSGSNRILQRMRRHYTTEQYRALIGKTKQQIPSLTVTTDVIVGFPTETEEDQADIKSLLAEVNPIRTHFFSYSRRAGTWAVTMADEEVPSHIIRQRMDRLRTLQASLTSRYLSTLVGQILDVVVEQSRDPSTHHLEGYSDTYVKCLLDGSDELKRTRITVRVLEARHDHVLTQATDCKPQDRLQATGLKLQEESL